MPHRSALSGAWQLLLALIFTALAAPAAKAQAPAGPVYKFAVEGVVHQRDAKPLVYALMEQPFATGCSFVPECACFKLSTNAPITYAVLREAIAVDGRVLTGDVEVSDGTVIHAPQSGEGK